MGKTFNRVGVYSRCNFYTPVTIFSNKLLRFEMWFPIFIQIFRPLLGQECSGIWGYFGTFPFLGFGSLGIFGEHFFGEHLGPILFTIPGFPLIPLLLRNAGRDFFNPSPGFKNFFSRKFFKPSFFFHTICAPLSHFLFPLKNNAC